MTALQREQEKLDIRLTGLVKLMKRAKNDCDRIRLSLQLKALQKQQRLAA